MLGGSGTGSAKKRAVHYVEMLRSRRVEETLPAILRITAKIDGKHQVQTVYRLHGDRAQEFTKMLCKINDRNGKSGNVDGRL